VSSLGENSLLVQQLIDRASDNPDYGTAMVDLIEARRIMDTVGIRNGSIRTQWEVVYSAVLARETPDSLPSLVIRCLT